MLTQAGPGTHVQQVERAVRKVKEGTRGLLHTLPDDCPLVIFLHLPGYVASRMPIFKSSTRPTDITAFQILYGRPFNAKVDGHLESGSYCQVSDTMASNAMDARTLGSIALGQIHNGAGIREFFSLHTGKVFTANHFTVLPMTDLVVKHLNKMARKDLKPPTREPLFRVHGTDLSDSPPSVKLDDFSPKELTQGPPITVTVDETDEDKSPIELTDTLSEVLDESTHLILRSNKPIRGVEEPTV